MAYHIAVQDSGGRASLAFTRLGSLVLCAGLSVGENANAGMLVRPYALVEFVPTSMSADGRIVAGAFPGYQGPPYSTGPRGGTWGPDEDFVDIGNAWEWTQPARHAISADGKYIAATKYGYRDWGPLGAFIWNRDTLESQFAPNSSQTARPLALTPDGSKLLWAKNDSSYGLYLWDGTDQQKISSETPYGAALNANGSMAVFYSHEEGVFRCWRQSNGITTLESPSGMIGAGTDVLLSDDASTAYAMVAVGDVVKVVRWAVSDTAPAMPEEICSVPREAWDMLLAGVGRGGRAIAFTVGLTSYMWTEESGVLRFEDFAIAQGIDFGIHAGMQVAAMNADATIFTGTEVTEWWSTNFWYLDLNRAPDASCPGDINHDLIVDDTDFALFAVGYDLLGCGSAAMALGCPADLNQDGAVDDADFVLFVVAYREMFCG